MATTPIFALPYPAPADPADVPADMQRLAVAVDGLLGGVSATPPASPVDGQIWTLVVDATNGMTWTFRYRAASPAAYKWEFVGGVPVWATVLTAQAVSSSGPGDPATVGPSFVIPRPGDYLVSWWVQASGAAGPASVDSGIALGAVGYTAFYTVTMAAAGYSGLISGFASIGGLAAATELRLRYSTTAACTVSNRRISVTPIRVS